MATATHREIASQLIGHLQNKTTDTAPSDLRVPASQFISESRAEAECELMRSVPLVIAHCSEIAKPGSFITLDVLGVPLILVRQGDGTVAAYVNVCRHRGGRVENEASGARRMFVCRYHGWTYNRDGGTLRNVPYGEFFDSVEKECNGLETVRVEERHGLIWANLSGDGEPVSEYLGPDLEAQLAPLGMELMTPYLSKSFTLDINWKLVMDGALDTLHTKFLHPDTVGKMLGTNTHVWRSFGRHGQLFSPRKHMNDAPDTSGMPDNVWRWLSGNILVFPNTFVINVPDHIEFWTVWPSMESPLVSTTDIRFLVRPEVLDDRMKGRMDLSWSILEDAALREDWPMEASIQSNASARPDRSFVYGSSELPCQHFHRQLQENLGSVD